MVLNSILGPEKRKQASSLRGGSLMIKNRKIIKGILLIISMFICFMLVLPFAQTVNGIGVLKETGSVDPVGHSENYSAILYNNKNGLPSSEANDIAETEEGFIWIGSYSGLIRYDGNTFVRMDSKTGVSSVVCLYADSYNRLWIGTNDSGLALKENDDFRLWGGDVLGSARVCCIAENDGVVYVGTTAGITMIYEDLTLQSIDDPRIAYAYMAKMIRSRDGLLHCLTNEGDYFTLKDGKVVDYISYKQTPVNDISCILPDPLNPDKMYIGTGAAGLYYGDIKGSLEEMEFINTLPLSTINSIRQYGSRIWVCAINGTGVLDKNGFHVLDELPVDSSVGNVMEDYEGNLWFTSTRQGVMKLVWNTFTDVFGKYGVEPTVVNGTCMYKDDLYVATDTGLIVIGEDGQKDNVPIDYCETASGAYIGYMNLVDMLDGCRIRSIIKDSSDRLWISTYRNYGLICYDGTNAVAYTTDDGLISERVRTVCEREDGSFIVANTGGVCLIEGGQITKKWGVRDGLTNPETLTVAAAPNGDIIVGSDGGGIYVVNDAGVGRIDTNVGLSSNIIMRIRYDKKREVFWIVTSNSLAWMTTDYKVTTIREFPYSNNFDLYENSNGDMWVIASNGIYVVPVDDLLKDKEINPIHYGIANGMSSMATSNSYSALTENGDLYIACNDGVVKVNIDEEMLDVYDLKEAVPYIDVDGERYYPDEKGGFTIPSTAQKIIVYPYVFNYSLSDPQINYILKGYDKKQVTVSRSELGPIIYTNVPGGSYKFLLEIKDFMGRGTKVLSIPIEKKKAMHEEPWFYFLVLLAGVLAIAALVKAIVRRKMRILEAKHREEAAMERLESELRMANRIQSSSLPHDFPPFPDRTDEFDIYASMDPAREIGGDFYDYFFVDDDHLCLVMADVSGKGIPAALFMMTSKAILKSFGNMAQSAAEILTKANDTICSDNQEEMFVTVWLGILEISTGRLIAGNAGHEYPVLKQDDRFELIKDKHGLVIGAMDGLIYRQYELDLKPGAKLFLYTDGVPEATNANNELFGTDRMIEVLNRDPDASPQGILENVRKAVDEFVKDAEQFDDLTMLCLEYKGPADHTK